MQNVVHLAYPLAKMSNMSSFDSASGNTLDSDYSNPDFYIELMVAASNAFLMDARAFS